MDLIERQAAIDTVDEALTSVFVEHRDIAEKMINKIPSAQPETHDKRTKTHSCDCISRHAVIDRAVTIPMFGRDVKMVAVSEIKNLPSAQPEPTTEIQEIINYLDTTLHPIVSPDNWNVYAELHDMVSKLPSAQFEVVRCKDCKYIDNDGVCQNSKGLAIQDDDDFCSHAERRTDEQTD